jgi:hypothetical protein
LKPKKFGTRGAIGKSAGSQSNFKNVESEDHSMAVTKKSLAVSAPASKPMKATKAAPLAPAVAEKTVTARMVNARVATAKVATAKVATAKIATAKIATAKIATAKIATAKIATAKIATAKRFS